MVLKLYPLLITVCSPFENDVEMYGAQAIRFDDSFCMAFENDVEMYGAQAETTLLIKLE